MHPLQASPGLLIPKLHPPAYPYHKHFLNNGVVAGFLIFDRQK